MRRVVDVATRDGVAITVPTAVLAEWWREPSDLRWLIRRMVRIEALDEELAANAGEAMASIPSATVVDAIVVASAARRGDLVYTSDYDDLVDLTRHFRGVRILGV
jgi:hypothetical protein